MKDVLKVVLAIIIVVLAWKIFKGLIGLVIGASFLPASAGIIFSRRDAEAQRGFATRQRLCVFAPLRETESSAFAELVDEEVAR